MGECNGVVFLSLCFDVNNKKLSVIILRAKDLNDGRADETGKQVHTWLHIRTMYHDTMFINIVSCLGYSIIDYLLYYLST